jgi:hypothetical protein
MKYIHVLVFKSWPFCNTDFSNALFVFGKNNKNLILTNLYGKWFILFDILILKKAYVTFYWEIYTLWKFLG